MGMPASAYNIISLNKNLAKCKVGGLI